MSSEADEVACFNLRINFGSCGKFRGVLSSPFSQGLTGEGLPWGRSRVSEKGGGPEMHGSSDRHPGRGKGRKECVM